MSNSSQIYFAVLQSSLLLFAAGCASDKLSNPQVKAATAQTVSCHTSNDPFAEGTDLAESAKALAKTARSTADWNAVAVSWLQAIQQLQTVPLKDPKRIFAQKKVKEYLGALDNAQQKALQNRSLLSFPTFNSQLLDEQLLLYLSYIAAMGVPDVLIVGSSRSLQGVDPQQLQQSLATQGKGELKVFNFGINGATAQVIDLLLRQVLTPEQLPKLIIWADGTRAFNSGRTDRTYNAIASSPGYQQILAGIRPSWPVQTPVTVTPCPSPPSSPTPTTTPSQTRSPLKIFLALTASDSKVATTDASGFLPLENRFDPETYYQKFPKVSGKYDSDYANFQLTGKQGDALNAVTNFTKNQKISLIILNLPLTEEYLDPFRRRYEQEFNQAVEKLSKDQGFIFINFSQLWLDRYHYFLDPSHLNRYGAAAVSQQLAQEKRIIWPVRSPETPAK
jgi:lysophospholipase L1-like esterase